MSQSMQYGLPQRFGEPDKWGWGYRPENESEEPENWDGTYMALKVSQRILSDNRGDLESSKDLVLSIDATRAIWQAIKEFCFHVQDDFSLYMGHGKEANLIEFHFSKEVEESPSIVLLRIMAPTEINLDGPWNYGLRLLNGEIPRSGVYDRAGGERMFVALAVGEYVRFYEWDLIEEQCVPLIPSNPRLNVER